ncbi:MAG: sulfopyruvate decarboxylase subunit alpha [Methanobacteriaceae archaeon]|nr:sulfopyruvate decarboxylase subunit alpha [Methanobacteriaceae archaeon]
MESTQSVYNGLKDAGINFIVSIPCVNLGKLLEIIDLDNEIIHVPVTREEEGFGIAAGAYMGGMKPAILMQNSGLGNSVNVLASLYNLYKIPILMIMSHRGTKGEFMDAQVPMGNATPLILDALNITYFNPSKEDAQYIIKKSWDIAKSKGVPVGILLEITFW